VAAEAQIEDPPGLLTFAAAADAVVVGRLTTRPSASIR
jgi:hypothetical protein